MKKIVLFLSLLVGELLSAGDQLVGLTLESNVTAMNLGEQAFSLHLSVGVAHIQGKQS
jgi:hypothetical protein